MSSTSAITNDLTVGQPAGGTGRSARSLWRNPLGLAACLAVALILLVAVLGPIIWGDQAVKIDTNGLSEKPSAEHLVGTDALGRDILARVLVATRLSIGLAIVATLIGLVIGVILGLVPAMVGRRTARFFTAAINIAVAFPSLLLAIFFAVIFGVGELGAVLALGAAGAPYFARLTETLAASVSSRDFVAAARVSGISRSRVVLRHILPNIAEPLVINSTMAAAANLLAFAGLSYLGIGVQAPAYDWGRLLNEGLGNIYTSPLSALAPGLAIVAAGLAFNLTGEAAAAAVGRRGSRRATPPPGLPARTDAAPGPVDADVVLDARNLWVRFPTAQGWVSPVRGVDLCLRSNESVGVLGESGSGKSLTVMAVAQLITEPGVVQADQIVFNGNDLAQATPRQTRRAIGDSIGFVFQDPMSSLNPVIRVGRQLAEVSSQHQGMNRRQSMSRAVDRLRSVRIPAPERRARQHPHQFSGGMRQRAMIGMGLMGTPRLLVADEPTTALDVTVQAQVLDVLADAQTEAGAALLMISHDVAVVASMCDRVLVMYAGKVVEEVDVETLMVAPRHPYTRALIAALPTLTTDLHRPLATIPGRPPAPDEIPTGCAFAPRCAFATDRCRTEVPPLEAADGTPSKVACWHPQDEPVVTAPDQVGAAHE
jgi:peptide/nickel transport system permease protein